MIHFYKIINDKYNPYIPRSFSKIYDTLKPIGTSKLHGLY
jgi:hypothetical protein